MKKLFNILVLLFYCCGLIAQTDSATTHADSAALYLTGAFKQYNPGKSFNLYLQRANAGEAKAMNAVAMHYTKGLGVDSSFHLAEYWFTQAANNGYTKALVNLGMLHKRHSSDSAGYAKAVHFFTAAVQLNEPSALFALGYMYYKGLGCTQSYTQALHYFGLGNRENRADCMYFTGLCYKNGYGVTANTDSATHYITKAAHKGYQQAKAELATNNNSNTAARGITQKKQVSAKTLYTAENPYQKPASIKTFTAITGNYTGTLTQYDYSGKQVVAQIPLNLNVHATANVVTGTWQQGNEAPLAVKAIQQGNQLIFTTQSFIAATIKARKQQQKLLFKTALFTQQTNNDSIYLTGSLELYNTITRETEKPIVLQLVKAKENNEPLVKPELLKIYPNPVNGKNSFTLSFKATETALAKLNIYNANGQLVYTQLFNTMAKQQQQITIPTTQAMQAAGVYYVEVNTRGNKLSTAYIKE